jgi:hypothetical protein
VRRMHATRAVRVAVAVALMSAGLPGAGCAVIVTGLPACRVSATAGGSPASGSCQGRAVTVYVGLAQGAVVPVQVATGTVGPPIEPGLSAKFGGSPPEFLPVALAITPDGKTAYVVAPDGDTAYVSTGGPVIPIQVATNIPGPPIYAGSGSGYIAIKQETA